MPSGTLRQRKGGTKGTTTQRPEEATTTASPNADDANGDKKEEERTLRGRDGKMYTEAEMAARVKRLSQQHSEGSTRQLIAGLISCAIAAVLFAAGFKIWFAWHRGSFDSAFNAVGLTGLTSGGIPAGDFDANGQYIGRVLTKEELETYVEGGKGGAIYLAILGEVFDVSAGPEYYGKEGGYSFFAGRDASAAYVTGDFDSDGLTDDTGMLTPRQMLELDQWADFYRDHETYFRVGRLHGRYYDERGNPTAEMAQVQAKLEAGRAIKSDEEADRAAYPPCNSRWAQGKGGEVWCSPDSGGIKRAWAGHPRKFFQRSGQPRCACVDDGDLDDPRFEVYEDCDASASRCRIKPKSDS